MCYYNGRRVTKDEHSRLKELERQIAFLGEDLAIFKGFDYNDYPVLRPIAGSHGTERVDMQWGFLPPYLKNKEAVIKFRNGYKDASGKYIRGYTTLNATSEELLNKLYRDAALHRRCLIPSNGFYEWRHVQLVGKSGKLLKTPDKFPYWIRLRDQPEFYMAGIWQPWTDKDTNTTTGTFAIVTTAANTLMRQIHNSKERMPTILPGDLAEAWLYKELGDQDILDIANYQLASAEMVATLLHRDFLKRPDPHEPAVEAQVPALVYG